MYGCLNKHVVFTQQGIALEKMYVLLLYWFYFYWCLACLTDWLTDWLTVGGLSAGSGPRALREGDEGRRDVLHQPGAQGLQREVSTSASEPTHCRCLRCMLFWPITATDDPWTPTGCRPLTADPWLPLLTPEAPQGGDPWLQLMTHEAPQGGDPWLPLMTHEAPQGADPWLPLLTPEPPQGADPWLLTLDCRYWPLNPHRVPTLDCHCWPLNPHRVPTFDC